ncbi:hypothetical protein PCASD_06503 [Puccinia coronata f. sp. avenae]|uniref:Uncharacterized protein n=1 Tax=Puccinia coronata f. sp. avenae TaxID=200324 RepID=A0A2N5V1Q9_9BASI|nr:hypothetical protein PCASD_06503 [Puccinia coronata f. sp. avenae]
MRSAIVASFLACVSLVSAFPTDPSTSQPDPPCGYPKPGHGTGCDASKQPVYYAMPISPLHGPVSPIKPEPLP